MVIKIFSQDLIRKGLRVEHAFSSATAAGTLCLGLIVVCVRIRIGAWMINIFQCHHYSITETFHVEKMAGWVIRRSEGQLSEQ
jgi:hypothetical protein